MILVHSAPSRPVTSSTECSRVYTTTLGSGEGGRSGSCRFTDASSLSHMLCSTNVRETSRPNQCLHLGPILHLTVHRAWLVGGAVKETLTTRVDGGKKEKRSRTVAAAELDIDSISLTSRSCLLTCSCNNFSNHKNSSSNTIYAGFLSPTSNATRNLETQL